MEKADSLDKNGPRSYSLLIFSTFTRARRGLAESGPNLNEEDKPSCEEDVTTDESESYISSLTVRLIMVVVTDIFVACCKQVPTWRSSIMSIIIHQITT